MRKQESASIRPWGRLSSTVPAHDSGTDLAAACCPGAACGAAFRPCHSGARGVPGCRSCAQCMRSVRVRCTGSMHGQHMGAGRRMP